MADTWPGWNGDAVGEQRIRELAYHLWDKAGRPDGRADEFWYAARREIESDEAGYDEALDETYPASDPPAHTPIG